MNGIQSHSDRFLIVIAAPAESQAARGAFDLDEAAGLSWTPTRADERFDLIESGVGKSQAAAATAFACARGAYAGVLSIGIGGMLPSSGGCISQFDLGSVVLASRSVFADEGAEMPDGFSGLPAMGFDPSPTGDGVPIDPAWRVSLESIVDGIAEIATVSTCAATDRRAAEIARRTKAAVEAMEGAAVGSAVVGLPIDRRPGFAEVRVISNTTGDRDRQRWDLDGALGAMREFLARLRASDPDLWPGRGGAGP